MAVAVARAEVLLTLELGFGELPKDAPVTKLMPLMIPMIARAPTTRRMLRYRPSRARRDIGWLFNR